MFVLRGRSWKYRSAELRLKGDAAGRLDDSEDNLPRPRPRMKAVKAEASHNNAIAFGALLKPGDIAVV